MNSTRLGLNATMVAAVGDDGFGSYFQKLSDVGVNTSHITLIISQVLFSRSEGTQISYLRCCIYEEQISTEILSKTKIFHTTCFALKTLHRKQF
jgi:fructokinase